MFFKDRSVWWAIEGGAESGEGGEKDYNICDCVIQDLSNQVDCN